MKLLFGSLLLASCCALSSWSVSPGRRGVNQSPDASVMEGETVNITCCWKRDPERTTVIWLKNKTEIKRDLFANYSQGSLQENASDCSHLTFVNITREDSGNYTCKVNVEIPILNISEGKGTVITVRSRENTTTQDDKIESSTGTVPVIISLAVAAPLLLLALVCFCTLKKRQARNQAARVIYEVPHIDSEEADMDKHSTSSSRGSSQWCQVPLYESVDYFERVETKESG